MAGQIINKVTAGGGTHLISPSTFFTCNTAGSTAAKVAKLIDTNVTGTISIDRGTVIWVNFSDANTINSPTLTLQDSTGTNLTLQFPSGQAISQPIPIYGAGTGTGINDEYKSWPGDTIVSFVFNGNAWKKVNSNTYTKVYQGLDNLTNASYPVIFSSTTSAATKTTNVALSSKITVNPSTGNLTVTSINGHGFSDSITTASSTALPTVSAVAAYVAESCPEEIVISNTQPDPTDTSTKIWVQL